MRERHNLSKLPAPFPVAKLATPLPRLNGYRCTSAACRHTTITVDVDHGVTPFQIGCDKCGADAHSMFYPTRGPIPPVWAATHEWYKPTEEETATLHPANADHVRRGGLLMRKRTDREPAYHNAP